MEVNLKKKQAVTRIEQAMEVLEKAKQEAKKLLVGVVVVNDRIDTESLMATALAEINGAGKTLPRIKKMIEDDPQRKTSASRRKPKERAQNL